MHRARVFLIALLGAAVWPAAAAAATFSYTGGEQTFVVPSSARAVDVVATGAMGGTKLGFPGGSGADVLGTLSVTPGEVLYVEVGGMGGDPFGGFNGGGNPAVGQGATWVGGGGASDVRTLPMSDGVRSLNSRLIVAGGGGGAPNGGNADQPTNPAFGAGAVGTQTSGGAGGCPPDSNLAACGHDGTLGQGGEGGHSGSGADDQRWGGGGGGGLYGGGGGGADLSGVGGGGGGSSLVPAANGTLSLAPLGTPPSIVITPLIRAGGNNLPVTGTGSGPLTFDFASSTGTTQIAGQMSQLGAFTASTAFTLNLTDFTPPISPYEITGTATFVAANGDKLFSTATGTGMFNSDANESSGVNVVTITGGSGRFAKASGTLVETYTVSAANVITVSIQGHISP